MIDRKVRWLAIVAALALMLPMFSPTSSFWMPTTALAHQDGCHARHSCPSDANPPSYVCGDLGYPCEVQPTTSTPTPTGASVPSGSRTFPETGKTVKAKFLQYWNTHGGLAQQGFPISEEMQEVSDTDGKTYKVQYFERAVFELHPEFAGTTNEILLSLLGVFFYNSKYGATGAPNQTANNEAGSRLFPETGKRIGGKFLAYWNSRGGLAQQGFPISEEFQEVSPLNGQTYKVQYFQRAVFELHPEFAGTPNEVLLSQLGTFRYREKYQGGGATPVAPTAVAPTVGAATPTTPAAPTSPPAPTNTPLPANTPSPCSDVPASVNAIVAPSNCARAGTSFAFIARGFQPGENIGVYVTAPDQSVFGAPFQVQADSAGISEVVTFSTGPNFPPGIWALTFEGVTSHNRGIAYFKLLAP